MGGGDRVGGTGCLIPKYMEQRGGQETPLKPCPPFFYRARRREGGREEEKDVRDSFPANLEVAGCAEKNPKQQPASVSRCRGSLKREKTPDEVIFFLPLCCSWQFS